MVIYNTTNISAAANLYEAAIATGQLEGQLLGTLIIFGVFFLVFIALIGRYSFESSILAGSFISTVMALFLRPAGIITDQILIILVGLTAIFAAYQIYQRK